MIIVMTYFLRTVKKDQLVKDEDGTDEKVIEKINNSQTFVYTALILVCVMILIVSFVLVRGTLWEGHLMEWMNIIVRLLHITFGIAWIGASFYFVFFGK